MWLKTWQPPWRETSQRSTLHLWYGLLKIYRMQMQMMLRMTQMMKVQWLQDGHIRGAGNRHNPWRWRNTTTASSTPWTVRTQPWWHVANTSQVQAFWIGTNSEFIELDASTSALSVSRSFHMHIPVINMWKEYTRQLFPVCQHCEGWGSKIHHKDAFEHHVFSKHREGTPNYKCAKCSVYFPLHDKYHHCQKTWVSGRQISCTMSDLALTCEEPEICEDSLCHSTQGSSKCAGWSGWRWTRSRVYVSCMHKRICKEIQPS